MTKKITYALAGAALLFFALALVPVRSIKPGDYAEFHIGAD